MNLQTESECEPIKVPVFHDMASRFDLSLVTTLLLLVIVPPSLWFIRIPVTIIGIFGIVFKPWRTSSLFWLVAFTFLIFECYILWFNQDNHKYLISYWCLAIGLSLSSESAHTFLRNNARVLIGLCFLIAVIAKVISPSYMDSTFFRVTLMNDSRFRAMATNVVGVDEEMFGGNARKIDSMFSREGPLREQIEIEEAPYMPPFAWFMTIWTLGIESAIAVSFLVPMSSRFASLRNYLLSLFILSTYAVANVIGFGWVLAVMGIAQLSDNEKWFATFYFLLIVVLHVYRVPWVFLSGL